MKKILFLLLLPLLWVSCESESENCDDMIWDFVCWDVVLSVENAAGEDLLDENTPGNLLENEVAVVHRGERFPLEVNGTRALLAEWNGFRRVYDSGEGKYQLLYGEFTPEGDYQNERFIIDWGDGQQEELEFDLYITWKKCKPNVHFRLSADGNLLNDERLEGALIK